MRSINPGSRDSRHSSPLPAEAVQIRGVHHVGQFHIPIPRRRCRTHNPTADDASPLPHQSSLLFPLRLGGLPFKIPSIASIRHPEPVGELLVLFAVASVPAGWTDSATNTNTAVDVTRERLLRPPPQACIVARILANADAHSSPRQQAARAAVLVGGRGYVHPRFAHYPPPSCHPMKSNINTPTAATELGWITSLSADFDAVPCGASKHQHPSPMFGRRRCRYPPPPPPDVAPRSASTVIAIQVWDKPHLICIGPLHHLAGRSDPRCDRCSDLLLHVPYPCVA